MGEHTYDICLYDWGESLINLYGINIQRNEGGYYDYHIKIDVSNKMVVEQLICNATNYFNGTILHGVEPIRTEGTTAYNDLNVHISNAEIVLGKNRNGLPMIRNVMYPFYYSDIVYVSVKNGRVNTIDFTDIFSKLSDIIMAKPSKPIIEELLACSDNKEILERICPIEDVLTYLDDMLK